MLDIYRHVWYCVQLERKVFFMNIYAVRQQLKLEGKSFYDLPLRVTYYARVSTEMKQQLNSLDNQIAYYEDYIRSHPDWTFVPGYVDEGISGVTTKKREQFNEMVEDAAAGAFDLIITKEVSRFARNTLDSLQYTRQLLACGVAVFFQNDNINTLDEDGELRLTIMSSMAQDESRKISSRVKFGHQQAIKKGVVLGNSNIFGYRKLDKRLVIDEEQAAVVRELFELYATGKYSMKQLETYFYDKGFRNSKGNKFSHTTMSSIISNPKYKGYYCGNKVRVVDLFTKQQEFLPEDEWVMYKDETGETVPAIVSEELWEKANEVLRARSQDVKTRQNKTVHQNLLTGKLVCAHCGRPYYRKDGKAKNGEPCSIWRCSGKINNGADSCPSCSLYENELIPILEEVFRESQSNIGALADQMAAIVEDILQTKDGAARIGDLNKAVEMEERKKQKLLQYNVSGQMSDKEYLSQLSACNREIERLQGEIAALTDILREKRDFSAEIARVRSILTLAQKSLDADEISRPFVDRFIKEIVVSAEEGCVRLEIRLNAGDTIVKTLEKAGGRSGLTSKKMIEAYENGMK